MAGYILDFALDLPITCEGIVYALGNPLNCNKEIGLASSIN
jgi:hypothetical protein